MRRSGDPHITHPVAAATILAGLGDVDEVDDQTLCAAVLHDTVEDTPYTMAALRREFGAGTAAMVADVISRGRRAHHLATVRAPSAACCSPSPPGPGADPGVIRQGPGSSRHAPGSAAVRPTRRHPGHGHRRHGRIPRYGPGHASGRGRRAEEAGLLARRPDPTDARLVRLYLTPRGRAAREPVREARAALERYATATLSPDELDQLHCVLTKIITQLQDRPA
jgi:hypothetical protein